MDENVEVIENDVNFDSHTVADAEKCPSSDGGNKPAMVIEENRATENQGSELKDDSHNCANNDTNGNTVEVASDLNCNVSLSEKELSSDAPLKAGDKLEMAVKQSEITFLDGDTTPASTVLEYKSAVEVYEKTGSEESLLSESVILNATDDGTIVIVTNAEQHSPSNIIVYEASTGYVETQPVTSENAGFANPIANDEVHVGAVHQPSITQPVEEVEEETTKVIDTLVQIDSANQQMVDIEEVEGETTKVIDTLVQIDTANQQVVDELERDQVESTTDVKSIQETVPVEQKQIESSTQQITESIPTVVNDSVVLAEDDTKREENTATETVTDEEVISGDNQAVKGGSDEQSEANELEDLCETNVTEKQIQAVEDEEINVAKKVQFEETTPEQKIVVNTKSINETGQDESIQSKVNQYETVEEQVSAIVKQDDAELPVVPEKTISIVEAITRDFDETDSEDADSANLKTESAKPGDIEQLSVIDEHDPDEQVYIVESTEELIVLDSKNLDQSDTIEVTVGENISPKCPSKPGKGNVSSRLLQIPSHVLGRNIINPADDPFRNGKVPPKPRLGVKIPYRNLTSQIVSKDEIAQEILERQRNKYGDLSQPTGDVLFAKKLTQRLARKIAPPQPLQQEAQSEETIAVEKINNSDLIAILEGDGDDTENKKHDIDVGTSNMDPQISKILERQIALKQLNELPRGRGRLRRINLEQVAVNKLKAQVAEKVSLPEKMKNLKTETASEKLDGHEKILNTNIKKEIQIEPVKSDGDIKVIKSTEVSGHQIVDEKPKNVNEVKAVGNEKLKKQDVKLLNPDHSDMKNVNNEKSKKPETKVLQVVPKELTKTEILNKSKDAIKDFPIERKFSPTAPIKTYTRKRKSSDDIQPPEKKPVIVQKEPVATYVTKSSRIIKRKVIWDPDEPSTTRSVILRSPKSVESPIGLVSTKTFSPSKTERKSLHKKSPLKSPDKSKKRLSEVDRLLMDEGAVNMLYAFKNTDDTVRKKKATVISLDKAQRELLNKTNEIKRDLTSSSDKVSPKSLRKKDSPNISFQKKSISPAFITRKKSKDSSQSSVQSRPSSPGLIYLAHHAEASRIIRRHSSSSYSSLEGEEKPNEQSEQNDSVTTLEIEPEKIGKRKNTSTAEIVKVKKTKQMDKDNEPLSVVAEKIKAGQAVAKKLVELIVEDVSSKYKTFSIKRIDHLVQIILLPSVNNQVYLTPEILQELTSILRELQQDNDCHVVLISSSAASFCQGVNYKTLVCDKEQTRKLIAKKLAASISTFLKTLSTFSKIVIAGVHGDAVGLGVTMLPLFDMVIASDTATFSIPNARLGCAVEGGSLLSLPHLMHNVLVSELLYASRKLIAAEALRLGMVTRVLWPDKFQKELMLIVKTISNHSLQFMQTTKKQLRHHMIENVDLTLTREADILIQHWTSAECQKNFGVYG